MAAYTSIRCFILRASAALLILGSSTCSCLKFGYPTFDAANMSDFTFSPGSGIANGSLQITPNAGDISFRSGRVCYVRETLKLWNSFSTEFVLNILPQSGRAAGGMAFILTNNPALPSNSSGQWLSITNNETDGAPMNRIVAVEFDTTKSFKDDLGGNHVGLDINSIKSIYGYPLSNLSIVLSSGYDVRVGIQYDAIGATLSILAYQRSNKFEYYWSIDLSRYLLDNITVGFAASTGGFTQLNQIKSWNFSIVGGSEIEQGHRTKKLRLKVLLAFLIPLTICLSLLVLCCVWWWLTRGQRSLAYRNLEKMIDAHGPIRFKLRELRNATANFSPARKLGMGGFGTVYLGYLHRMEMEVAVKRVSASGNSRRGEQEFVAEVNSISKLSHRNLVKLIGWCHEGGELLLVYEYFPMGSLDKLLYAGERRSSSSSTTSETTTATAIITTATAKPELLTWERRYKIICGVASALDYLHHGSSRRILHRDVKASNVMLDEECGARLGDFGLARVIEHDGVTHHSTEAVAGTRGYMAYEIFFTGRASLDTDVFAFGVFAMEVISGRRPSSPVLAVWHNGGELSSSQRAPVPQAAKPMYIVDWMWRIYGEGRALDAADAELGGEFDPAQVDCAVRLALACCHPNPRERPSMRTAVQVLIGGATAPEPPFQKPAFVWPPRGDRQEIELPHVGVLFTGVHTSFCSLTCSVTGR